MTVKQLVQKLSELPQESLEMQVAIYNSITEDGDLAGRVAIYSKEHAPYEKGDSLWMVNDLPADEKLVYIR